METLRVYRPRLVLHGQPEMGQGYVGAALLHFLEGYHVQSLDLGTLMGDSTRVSKLLQHSCPPPAMLMTRTTDARGCRRAALCRSSKTPALRPVHPRPLKLVRRTLRNSPFDRPRDARLAESHRPHLAPSSIRRTLLVSPPRCQSVVRHHPCHAYTHVSSARDTDLCVLCASPRGHPQTAECICRWRSAAPTCAGDAAARPAPGAAAADCGGACGAGGKR